MAINERDELERIVGLAPNVRRQFEMEIEHAALEVIEIAKQISSAIGDVSVGEAKNAILREFAKRL